MLGLGRVFHPERRRHNEVMIIGPFELFHGGYGVIRNSHTDRNGVGRITIGLKNEPLRHRLNDTFDLRFLSPHLERTLDKLSLETDDLIEIMMVRARLNDGNIGVGFIPRAEINDGMLYHYQAWPGYVHDMVMQNPQTPAQHQIWCTINGLQPIEGITNWSKT